MVIVGFQKERSAEPGTAQGTPVTGLKEQHKADAPCGARTKAVSFGYKSRCRLRVTVFLETDLTHARHLRLSVRTNRPPLRSLPPLVTCSLSSGAGKMLSAWRANNDPSSELILSGRHSQTILIVPGGQTRFAHKFARNCPKSVPSTSCCFIRRAMRQLSHLFQPN
jgi:hypothetical protein